MDGEQHGIANGANEANSANKNGFDDFDASTWGCAEHIGVINAEVVIGYENYDECWGVFIIVFIAKFFVVHSVARLLRATSES